MKKEIFALALAALSAGPLAAQGRLFSVDWVVPQAQDPNGHYSALVGDAPQGLLGNIHELDPVTGAELNVFDAPAYTAGPEGLAFDGNSLWFLTTPLFGKGPNDSLGPVPPLLYELDPDTGAVRDTDDLLGVGAADGLAALGGLIYISDYENDVLFVFDPASESIVGTIDIGAANPLRDFVGGLDGYEAGGSLIITADPLADIGDGGVHVLVFLDPVTGAELSSFPLAGNFDAGLAALGTTIYAGEYDPAGGIDVYDPSGNLLDTFAVPYGVSGLAAGGVAPPSVLEVPAISPLGAGLLVLALFAAAVVALRRRRA